MNNKAAIANWIYFCYNFPDPLSMFIQIYGDNLGKHIFSKWIYYERDFNRLFCYLDKTCQNKLLDYVLTTRV